MSGSDPALVRFFVIQAVRIAGVAGVLLGMLVVSERVAWPRPLGLALLGAGLIGVFLIPTLLVRRWRTPR